MVTKQTSSNRPISRKPKVNTCVEEGRKLAYFNKAIHVLKEMEKRPISRKQNVNTCVERRNQKIIRPIQGKWRYDDKK